MRIVSLLPSTTEILFALGAGDHVVGVTFECDTPAEARSRTIVSTTALPEGLATAEIDAFVTQAVRNGDDLYHLDAGALRGLDPDLVVTQDLCAVCAIDVDTVGAALDHLGCSAEVLTVDPHTLAEVLDSVGTLGRATGTEERARELTTELGRAAGGRGPLGRRPTAPAHAAAGVDGPAVRARALGPRDGGPRRWPLRAGRARPEVRADHVGRGRRVGTGGHRVRAVRLRPRRRREGGGAAGRGRRASARRTRLGGRRQRGVRPPRAAPRRRHRGAVAPPAPRSCGAARRGRSRRAAGSR